MHFTQNIRDENFELGYYSERCNLNYESFIFWIDYSDKMKIRKNDSSNWIHQNGMQRDT